MPAWMTLAITIINAVTQVVRLIIELNRKDPQEAKQLPAALKSQRVEVKQQREGRQ